MNVLTIDVEEWFHLLDNDSTKTSRQWERYEVRIHENMDRILNVLERNKQKATFFCLGWIAKKYPDVIRTLVSAGYEIASHGDMHQLVYEQSPEVFRRDLEQSICVLEDVSGLKIRYYRAPGFSIRKDNVWAFDILAERGIEVDCSVFPLPRAHGGFPSYNTPMPSILIHNGIQLKELPMSYTSVAGMPLMFSGGGYFRLVPYGMIRLLTARSDYVMSYLHPRDFDACQPKIGGLSPARFFKSYVGISGALDKLERWIKDFSFVDIKTALAHVDWQNVPVVDVT